MSLRKTIKNIGDNKMLKTTMANNTPPNGPSKTGNKSGGGRGNNPPKK